MLSIINQVLSVGTWGLILTGITILGSFITTIVLIIRAHQKDLDGKLSKEEFSSHRIDHNKLHDEINQRLSSKVGISVFEQEQEMTRAIIASIKMEVDEYKKQTNELIKSNARIEEGICWIKERINNDKRRSS